MIKPDRGVQHALNFYYLFFEGGTLLNIIHASIAWSDQPC